MLSQDKRVLALLADMEQEKFNKLIELIKMYSTMDYDVYEIISILDNSKFPNEFYKVLTNKNVIEACIALEGAKIINESPNEFNAKYASGVLTNKNAINAGIALEGARIINESPSVFNANYAKYVLTNEEAINRGVALEEARRINYIEKELCAKLAFGNLDNEAKKIEYHNQSSYTKK